MSLKQGTKYVKVVLKKIMLIESSLLNVFKRDLITSWEIAWCMPFIEPEISNKITTSFEQVAACIYHGRRRVSKTLGLADHLIAKNNNNFFW